MNWRWTCARVSTCACNWAVDRNMALRPPLMSSVQWNRWMEKGNIETGRDNTTWGGKGGQKVGGRERWSLWVEKKKGWKSGKWGGGLQHGQSYLVTGVLSRFWEQKNEYFGFSLFLVIAPIDILKICFCLWSICDVDFLVLAFCRWSSACQSLICLLSVGVTWLIFKQIIW